MKNLLVVAYSFPPSSVIGTHRTLAFVKYLKPTGWRSTVLCADNPIYPERDHNLLAQIPADTPVLRTRDRDLLSVLQPMYRWIRGPGTRHPAGGSAESNHSASPWRALQRSVALRLRPPGWCMGWYRSTLREGRRLLRNQRMDALFSSGPPWSGHLVALTLANEFDLPWVADFRDQWVSDPFDEPPTPPSIVKRDRKAEARVMDRADVVLCVIDTLREVLQQRYPARRPENLVTIMNGFDPENVPGEQQALQTDPTQLQFLHTGHFYGKRRIEPFLEAVRRWTQAEPAMAPLVRLDLLGGGPEYLNELQGRVAAAGNPGFVRIDPEAPYQESLSRQTQATILLLVGFAGPGDHTQMSGKIFEYLAARRPILALAPPASPVGDVLRSAGVRHWIVSPADQPGILRALQEIGEEWRRGSLSGPQSASSLAAYDRREQTKELARTLERAIAARAGARRSKTA